MENKTQEQWLNVFKENGMLLKYLKDQINTILEEFEQYCYDENYIKVKEYLNMYKELVNYKDGYFLKIVADKGNLDLIKLFVENGGNINDNNYILYTCAYNNHIECFNYLISIGANIETIKNTCGYNKAKILLEIYLAKI